MVLSVLVVMPISAGAATAGTNVATAGYQTPTKLYTVADISNGTLVDLATWDVGTALPKGNYAIKDAEGLCRMSALLHSGKTASWMLGYNVYIVADIDMATLPNTSAYAAWKTDFPGFSTHSGQAFEGNFNGQGYTISNLDMYVGEKDTAVELIGLFGLVIGPCTISNVVLDDTCDFTMDSTATNVKMRGAGTLVAWAHLNGVNILNCKSSANLTYKKTEGTYEGYAFYGVGGLVGSAREGVVIDNCTFEGTVNSYADNTGGIVGAYESAKEITDCTNSGSVHTEDAYFVGGIVGKSRTNGLIIKNCSNSGKIDTLGGYRVGGIVGYAEKGGTVIHNCTNSGEILSGRRGDIAVDGTTVGGSWAGGIAGHLDHYNNEVLDCVNTGAVTGTGMVLYNSSWVGGIVGSTGGIAILRCSNSGAVSSRGARTGGILGNANGSGNIWIQDCVNNARIGSNGANAAGIGGYIEGSSTTVGKLSDGTTVVPAGVNIINCTNNGEVVAGGNAGGIAGVVIYKSLVSNCVNKGAIDGVNAAGIVCQQATANPLTIQNCKNYSKIIDRTKATDHVDQNILDYKDANCVYTSTNNNDYVETAQWLGYQVTAVYTEGGVQYQDIRFVGTIDSLDYKSVGFNYKVTDTRGTVKQQGSYTCQYVYTELYAEGGNLLASNYRPGGYLFSLTVKKIPVSVGALTFEVETFALETAVNGSALIKGEEKTFHHVVGDKAAAYTANNQYTVSLDAPTVVYQSPSNMNQKWGYYQFPRFYSTPDGAIIANWNYSEDSALGGGGSSAAIKNAISYDGGKTWTPISDANAGQYVREYTVPTEDGRYFVSFNSGGSYKIPKSQITSTVYATGKTGSTTYNVYLASDIANLTLTDAEGKSVTAFKNPNQINMTEYYAETRTTATSTKTLNWNNMPVYGYIEGDYIILSTASSLMAISSRYGMVEKDGVLYYATYTRGFDPKNTSASFANAQDYHYGVFVFKSTDGGDSWNCISRITYSDLPAGGTYEDGPCEPVLNVMPDGSLVIVARTGGSWGNYRHPTVLSRSTDGGVTWSKPTTFGTVGVLPQMLTLDCGVTIATYGRPGLFFRTTADASGQTWNAQTQITDLSPVKTGTTQ